MHLQLTQVNLEGRLALANNGKVDVVLSGSKERGGFGSRIGENIDQETGVSSPTTKGVIHYGGKGIQIVPARP